ncbi:DUF4251 domain-containing protein [Aestuariivivens insulae]|uniref:DUF4251 domain-containing protein n=1 Tax=Aestuariivivens insulae TaxID=1621988 RepID=UPI001F5664E6|nr:DUF4251 domain-containing protein [Aestuariivivens insulae]
MKLVLTYIGVCAFFLVSCSSAKPYVTEEQKKAMETLVNSKQFQIESNWAYPQVTNAVQQVLNSGLLQQGSSSGGINLIGNTNFLKLSKDSISSYLPYYGERTMNAGYNSSNDGAIRLEGTVSNYEVTLNKDGSYSISFDAKSRSESYSVYLRLFPNMRTDLLLNGVYRMPIRYSGNAAPLRE